MQADGQPDQKTAPHTPPNDGRADSRALQANERTMLAWLRTGIALIAFGFVLARLAGWLEVAAAAGRPGMGAAWIGEAFVAFGVLTNGIAVFRFAAIRRALLRGSEIGSGPFPVLFGALVTLLGAAVAAYLMLRQV